MNGSDVYYAQTLSYAPVCEAFENGGWYSLLCWGGVTAPRNGRVVLQGVYVPCLLFFVAVIFYGWGICVYFEKLIAR